MFWNRNIIKNDTTKSTIQPSIVEAINSVPSKNSAKQLMDIVSKEKASSILEIGCGTGIYTKLLLLQFPEADITSIDHSKDMINVASKKPGCEKIKFLIRSAQDMDSGRTFDLITSNSVFQWIENFDLLFKKYSTMLSENGLLCFSIYGPKTFNELESSLRLSFGGTNWLSSSRFLDKILIRDYLLKYFSNIKICETNFIVHFNSLMSLCRNIKLSGTRGYGLGNELFLGKENMKKLIDLGHVIYFKPKPDEYKGMMWSLANGIFYADALGQFARYGISVANQYAFQEISFGMIRGWDKRAGWEGNRWDQQTIRPKALAFQMITNHFGDHLVESALTGVPSYYKEADWWPDSYAGQVPYVVSYASISSKEPYLSIVLINKHKYKNFKINIDVHNAQFDGVGEAMILTGPSLSSQNDGAPGTVTVDQYELKGVGPKFSYTIPARSVNLLKIPIKNPAIPIPKISARMKVLVSIFSIGVSELA